jgi:methyl-accepting chemotaxis protein
MNHSSSGLIASLTLTLAALAPGAGLAQPRPTAAQIEVLTAQEREMLGSAQDLSRRVTETMEAWLAAKEVTEDRLFSFLYYPIPRTDPPKFTTDWDRLSDRDIGSRVENGVEKGIQEVVLARSQSLVYVVLVDKHGYLPTHNLRYSQPLTGNLAVDLVNNRTKRIFNDKTGLAAAKSTAPFLLQRYQRDTGETMIDLSVPVYLRGQHWGAVRLGFRAVESR